jgi:hypothetical protein
MNICKLMAPVLGVVLVFTLAKLHPVAFAFDSAITRSSLRGLPGIFVLVQRLNPELEAEGLTKEQIESDVESRLRMSKIGLLSKEQYSKSSVAPFLHVVPAVLRVKLGTTSLYAYTVIVRLSQRVHLVRNPEIETSAFTWTSEGTYGAVRSVGDIRTKIADEVDKFISAYISVNPK